MFSSFKNFLYDTFNPPGHPIHIKHILRGRFSRMDYETIRYHYRRNKDKLSEQQINVLQRVMSNRECNSEEEVNAVKHLQSFIEPDITHLAGGSFLFVSFSLPLLAGSISIIILLASTFSDSGLFQSRISKMKVEILSLNEKILESTD